MCLCVWIIDVHCIGFENFCFCFLIHARCLIEVPNDYGYTLDRVWKLLVFFFSCMQGAWLKFQMGNYSCLFCSHLLFAFACVWNMDVYCIGLENFWFSFLSNACKMLAGSSKWEMIHTYICFFFIFCCKYLFLWPRCESFV